MARLQDLPPVVAELAKEYNIAPDEVWVVPGGKTCAIKHPAIERMAAQAGIQFGAPQVLEGNGGDRIVALMGTAKMGDRVEWSIGEAAPYNNKNAYPWAIAEKRLKARLTLKLLAAHGYVYSEVDADDFKQPAGYEPPGEPVEKRPSSNSVKKTEPDFWPTLEKEVRATTTREELTETWRKWKDKRPTLPIGWVEPFDDLFHVQADKVNDREAAE